MADTEFARLHDTIRAYQRSQAVVVAARLGIADLLADGSQPVAALAAKTGCDADGLYRLLRALASIGVLHEDDDRGFSLTAAGEYLRRDHPLSLDPVARMFCADYEWRAWGALQDGVRTGETGVRITEGTDVWDLPPRPPGGGRDVRRRDADSDPARRPRDPRRVRLLPPPRRRRRRRRDRRAPGRRGGRASAPAGYPRRPAARPRPARLR